MANQCSNYINILDCYDLKKEKEFYALLNGLEENDYEPKNKKYRWMCELVVENNTIQCISRWDACIGAMVELAKQYELSFNLEYEEGGNCLFGEYYYDFDEDELTHRSIPEKEWICDDGTSDCWYEDMEGLLYTKNFEPVPDENIS